VTERPGYPMCMRFSDRNDAGRRLADRLAGTGLEDAVVLGLPRGGVPVAAHVAAALGTQVHVFVARKIGAPGHRELGIGAIAEGSDDVVVSDVAARVGVSADEVKLLAEEERAELERRVRAYRGSAELPPIEGRDVVLVDDGLATGVTAEAALTALRAHRPRRLVFAAPVCASQSAERLRGLADEVVCLTAPDALRAIGLWYERFEPTSDDEVVALLSGGTKEG
jgi:putative phosphoribosyl transferase